MQQLELEGPGVLGDHGVVVEQPQQGRVAGGGLGEDDGDAVEALELLGAPGLGEGVVRLHPGPLLAHEQRDDLELRAHRGRHPAALHGRLDLAHDPREHRHDAVLVVVARPSLMCGAAACACLLGWSTQTVLL